MDDMYAFCSSFIDDKQESFSLPSVQVQDEEMFSAFEEITEEMMKQKQQEQLKKQKSIMEQSLIAKMRTLSIDYKATKLYFKCLKDGIANNEHNQDLII